MLIAIEGTRPSDKCSKHGGMLHKPTTCADCWPNSEIK